MTNRYLTDNFAPVLEELTVTEPAVTGTLPAQLDGRYLRNGPNPVTPPDPATHHWFVGTGMVHGLRLRDGRAAWYRNRWVRSAGVADALGEQARPGPIHEGRDFAANTHVIAHAGRTLALVEGGSLPYELTDTLDTVGPCDLDGTLPGGFAAHTKRDPATGELHAVAYFFGWGNQVQHIVVSEDGRVRRAVDIPVTGSPAIHDLSLTSRSIVVYDLPLRFDLDLAASGAFPYRWDPDYPARVGVLPRTGTAEDIHWHDVEPCYVFHPLNAFDDGDDLVIDVIRHEKVFDQHRLGPDDADPTLERWTVSPSRAAVKEERLDDRPQEFPRIDERLTGNRHRIGYTVGATDNGAFPLTHVIRHDLTAGTIERRGFGPGTMVDEFVFVPRAEDAAENDGYLLGFVYHRAEDRSDLAVLDAASLETVALVHLPARVPHGFHGSWCPAD